MSDEILREERNLYLVLASAMLATLAVVLASRGAFDGGTTILTIILLLAVAGLVSVARQLHDRERPARVEIAALLAAITAIAIVTALGLLLAPALELADITMLYLIAIAAVAFMGRAASLLAATLSVAAFDYCFVPPRFTFEIRDARHLLTFAVMFGAGLTISALMTRIRRYEREAAARAAEVREVATRAHTEELRSSLLSTVSHDLRTPLAVITGAATTLRDDSHLSPETRTELLSSIVDDARRLERILGNLLQLTRLETGLVPNREPVPVEELVGAALTRLEDSLGTRALEVSVPADLSVSVDPVLYEHVLINLVDNAIKHGTPPFEIRARAVAGSVEITIRDHGRGVSGDEATRLFDKFVRASTAPGAGLGLAVVRAIVEAHRGRVTIEHPEGGGLLFRITMGPT
jgi:K+-sensing histidine kinase KdpD